MLNLGKFSLRVRTPILENALTTSPYNNIISFYLMLTLRGRIVIINNDNFIEVKQCFDYTYMPSKVIKLNKCAELIEGQLEIAPDSGHRQNREFYQEVLLELCHYFYFSSKKNYTSAFVHAYRMLERLSFCVPLIYIQRTTNFKQVYEDMKKFFNEVKGDEGELMFFRKTLPFLLSHTELSLLTSYTLNEKTVAALGDILSNEKVFTNKVEYEHSTRFEMNFDQAVSFFVKVRNRFFHAASGKKHISLINLQNPDQLFSEILPGTVNILGIILGKILDSIYRPIGEQSCSS